jgi:serine/threonine-protein kinase
MPSSTRPEPDATDVPAPRTSGGQPSTGTRAKLPTLSPEGRYAPDEVIAGKYRLVRVLGEGGMGAVWLAENTTLDVSVAIKLIRHDLANAEMAERLLQEARAAARIGHPSIVRVFDFGETAHGDPFIVMELLEGESLGDVLGQKGRLPAASAVRTLLPVASALAAAHGKGIVHRDLKPDNILLVHAEGDTIVPKLVDFGVAKLRRDEHAKGVTKAGMVVGSPEYMSPEQARGEDDIDERADVWALAVVLYETITGVRPFEADNYNALLRSIVEDEATPTTDFGAGDAELWTIVERGLAKDRAARWQSMREIGAALADWCLGREITTDIAGTALASHWHGPASIDGARRVGDRLSLADIAVGGPISSKRRAGLSTPPDGGHDGAASGPKPRADGVGPDPGLRRTPTPPGTSEPPRPRAPMSSSESVRISTLPGGEPARLSDPLRASEPTPPTPVSIPAPPKTSRMLVAAAVGGLALGAIALVIALGSRGPVTTGAQAASSPAPPSASPAPGAATSAAPTASASASSSASAPISASAPASAAAPAAKAKAAPPRPTSEPKSRRGAVPVEPDF